MSRNLTYTFEEAPLFMDLGFATGFLNGEAEISYDLDGQWSVASISIEGSNGKVWKQIDVCRDSHPAIYGALLDHIENACKSSVQDAVDREIEQEMDDAGERQPTARELYA